MKDELSEYAGGLSGFVRMQANASAISEFLPEALKEFLVANPGIDVDLEEKSSYEIVRSVAGGYVEVGIAADIVDFGEFEVFRFATDRLVLITPRDHSLANQRALPFRACLTTILWAWLESTPCNSTLDNTPSKRASPLKLRVRLGRCDAVCRMVGTGIGLDLIPETAALRCKQAMDIRTPD